LAKPSLVLVQGDGIPEPAWLAARSTIYARSPVDKDRPVAFRLALHDVRKALHSRRRQPIFDLWSVLFGEPPPVNNVHYSGHASLISLSEAHACFRGIRRPIGEDDHGDNVVIYVLRPREHYVYRAHMVTVAHREPVPADVVFVCYARLDVPETSEPAGTKGVVTHWQFVEAAAGPRGELLPIGYEDRYGRRLW
jgi:hypothetical protein